MLCAGALHLAFPPVTCWWLAPFALAGLFALWFSQTPRAAALTGYLAGLVFFGLGFSWFGETAGTLIGPFAPVIDLGPAAVEACAFAAAAAVASLAARRLDPRAVPVVAAAAFALAEGLRSTGPLGVPLETFGLAMIDSPLRPLASLLGGYGLTFATALAGASLALWLLAPRERRRALTVVAAWAGIVVLTAAAWAAWPARHAPHADRTVAAVQGGIAQTLKMTATGRELGIARYVRMTETLRSQHPSLVLWPETVITLDLTGGVAADRDEALRLRRTFAQLAARLDTILWAGAQGDDGTSLTNTLWVFDPAVSRVDAAATYTKEQLVPFAEYLPGPAWLRSLPGAANIGVFAAGRNAAESYRGATALICWESVFGDIAHARLASDPALFLIATDDAWFGKTEGPYEHAEAATLRAVETGRWVLRAGATGISGIVAPDGRWTARTPLDVPAVVVGRVGAPAPPFFARLGPNAVLAACALLALVPFLLARRRRPT